MVVTQQNYLRILEGAEAIVGQVLRFVLYSKRPVGKALLKVHNDLRSIITEEIRQNRKNKIEQLKEEQEKRSKEYQQKIKEQVQQRLRRTNTSDD